MSRAGHAVSVDGRCSNTEAELPIGELRKDTARVLGAGASGRTLHYCSPAHGGWGVVRTALLIPESYLLFACPPACGRHGAIAAIEHGFKERVGYLCITESEVVLGGYEAEIRRGAREALRRIRPRPRALLLCVSCIDDLLGTDHAAAMEEMETEFGIPVRLARMNPIQLDGRLPPGQRIQRTVYEFLEPGTERDWGVLVLGSFVPPGPDSELSRFLAHLGRGPLRHPGLCSDFDEFRTLARSYAAITLRPEGNAAATYVTAAMGIQSAPAPIAFSSALVERRYREMAEFLGAGNSEYADAMDFVSRAAAQAAVAAAETARSLTGLTVAVDSTATASPFDLALALAEAGIEVTRVYAYHLADHERESFAALARLLPTLLVCNPCHPSRHERRPGGPKADMAVGFEAAYAAGAPLAVPVAFDEGLYGFEGFRSVLNAMVSSVAAGPADLEAQVRDYGLVV
ncbi:MAG TPA: nitrogenase component 1 [Magnetospirillaceae bacterium]|nr:nitrogenase component 1 [Magnetospirillaceae bacterium]